MPTTTNVQQVKVNIMTEAQYEDITPNSDEFYAVTDAQLSYNDLVDKPSIGNATLTIQKNGTSVDTFTANATSDKTINITVPTQASDVGAVASNTAITGATKCKITYDSKGLVTAGADLASGDITTALGYTPYDSSNPSGYTSNTGTVTSVNNVSPVSGNVTLSIPTVNNPTITITQGGVSKGSFTLNQASDETIALDAGGGGGNYCSFPDYSTTPETFTKAGGDVTGYYTLDKNYWMFSGASIRIGSNTGRQITSGGALCCVPVPSGTTIYVSGANAFGYPMT